MRIFVKRTLQDFWERHSDAEETLRLWYNQTQQARWNTPAEVRADHPTASILRNDRVVFRIRGNDYRLVVHILYRYGRVYIRFVGTHAEYDRINALEV